MDETFTPLSWLLRFTSGQLGGVFCIVRSRGEIRVYHQ